MASSANPFMDMFKMDMSKFMDHSRFEHATKAINSLKSAAESNMRDCTEVAQKVMNDPQSAIDNGYKLLHKLTNTNHDCAIEVMKLQEKAAKSMLDNFGMRKEKKSA